MPWEALSESGTSERYRQVRTSGLTSADRRSINCDDQARRRAGPVLVPKKVTEIFKT